MFDSNIRLDDKMAGKIIGYGSYLPSKKLSNEDLSHMVETNNEWIVERTGIESRNISDPNVETTSYMASEAAIKAIENAGIDAKEIDLIIVATTTPNYVFPSMSCIVQRETGAINSACFDLNSACPGFVTAFNTAQAYINAGQYETILVVGSECLSNYVDWKDRGTCILFGDGAGAIVLKKNEKVECDFIMRASGKRGDCLHCESAMQDVEQTDAFKESIYMRMKGQEVFKFAVTEVPKVIEDLLAKIGKEAKEIDLYVLHQANKRIIESVSKRLKVDILKFPMNIQNTGNTSSASIPVLLDELRKKGELKEGMKLVLSSFGGGLSWGATYIEL
jgi:3-oxoacyl-[acyl-carrier-protein] synthase III